MIYYLSQPQYSTGLCIALALVAAVFLVRGFWCRRVGTTPFCRHCDYNLTGISGDRCPECGTVLAESRMTFVRHIRRPGYIATGILILIPAFVLLSALLQKISLVPLLPFGVLTRDFQSSDHQTAILAWDELDRRLSAGKLSAEQQSRLVDACLAVQARPLEGRSGCDLKENSIDYLGNAYLTGGIDRKSVV